MPRYSDGRSRSRHCWPTPPDSLATPRASVDRTAQVIIAGHAFMQNLRRGHYELATEAPAAERVAVAFTELARAI